MDLDPLILSRIQFAFVVSFHAIFPVFTIGLAAYIAVLEGLLLKTENPVWEQLARFWTKVFAVVFGMGVVSGIVMAFQFGTNWSNFAYASANFLGPMLSYEVVTAFFLEAAFLGVLLFGRGKVPQGVHVFSAFMVALGTIISSFWILSASSWMHTPAGVELRDGLFHVTSWGEAIFNASFPYRLAHMVLASFVTGGFVVAGVSAWYMLRGRYVDASRQALSMSLWLLVVLTPAQIVAGDLHGLNTLEHQPIKVAAMEGNWRTQSHAPLLLFALPDQAAQENHLELGIPALASYILKHEWHGVIPGVQEAAPDEQPPVAVVFWAFRVMVGLGVVMLGFALWSLLLRFSGRLFEARGFLRGLTWMIPVPFVAVLAGWFTTEIGRTPWLVHGQMTQSEGLTPALTGGMALFTLVGYIVVYAIVFAAGIYYLTRIVRAGMDDPADLEHAEIERASRPMSAAHTPFDTGARPATTE